jgi:hypothetical protein
MSELYKFDILEKKLTEWGFPLLKTNSGFQIIKGVDFAKAYASGSISFEMDGIYLEYQGMKYRGYMHLAESYMSRFNSHPKFHLTKCQTIQDFIARGIFRQRYIWSNSNKVDIVDDETGQEYKDITLRLCNYCKQQMFDLPATTQAFYDSLDKSKIESEIVEIDIFGYNKNWQKISKAYKESKNYICENCGIKPASNLDRRFFHTHHKDGDKTNNEQSNLECLCILCHSHKDYIHEENFDKYRIKRVLDAFVKKYQKELNEINNPYINDFLQIQHNF